MAIFSFPQSSFGSNCLFAYEISVQRQRSVRPEVFFSHRPFSDSFRQPRLFHLAKPEEPFSNCARISLRRQWFPSVPLNLPWSLIIHLHLLLLVLILLLAITLLSKDPSLSPPTSLDLNPTVPPHSVTSSLNARQAQAAVQVEAAQVATSSRHRLVPPWRAER